MRGFPVRSIINLLFSFYVSFFHHYHQTDGLSNLEADAYNALNIEQTYCTTLSNGEVIELVEGGVDMVVQCQDRDKYSHMVRKARMLESVEQVTARKKNRQCSDLLLICSSLSHFPFSILRIKILNITQRFISKINII